MVETESLTVRELVAESELGLRLLTGERGLDKAVKAIHLSDLRDPTPRLLSGTVLLTTGPAFATDIEAGLRLLDRLARIEAAALGVATGHHLPSVHEQMIERAVALNMALFEIPFEVPARTVMAYVYDALASSDLHRLRRTVAVQNRLLRLFVEEHEIADVVASVAELLEMPVMLFEGTGRTLVTAGSQPAEQLAQRLWRAYLTRGAMGPLGVVEAGRDRFYFRQVDVLGRVERVVAAASSPAASSEFVDTALSFLEQLVALDLLRTRDEIARRRRERQRLLGDFLIGDAASKDLETRLADQGFDLRQPWRIAIFEARPHHSRRGLRQSRHELEDQLIEAVDAAFSQQRSVFLSLPHETSAIVLRSFPDADTKLVRGFLAECLSSVQRGVSGAAVVLGCSESLVGAGGGWRGLRQAREACLAARRAPTSSRLVVFDEISACLRLLDSQSEETLADLVERTIAPLVRFDAEHHTQLLGTLKSLFENGLAIQQTADSLYVHRNTLHQRLRHIEQLLEVDLTRLDDVFELYLGLQAAEIMSKPALATAPAPRV